MEKRKVRQKIDDGWENLANSAIEGGLPFLLLVIKQFFREIFGKKENK